MKKPLFIACLLLANLCTGYCFASAHQARIIANDSSNTKNLPLYDPEIDQNKLMLLDATLELNEALLAGVNASLDTVVHPTKAITAKMDTVEKLRLMKRERDRLEMKAYLANMKDSLTRENTRIVKEKETVQAHINTGLGKNKEQVATIPKEEPKKVVPKAEAIVKKEEVKAPVVKKEEKPAPEKKTENPVVDKKVLKEKAEKELAEKKAQQKKVEKDAALAKKMREDSIVRAEKLKKEMAVKKAEQEIAENKARKEKLEQEAAIAKKLQAENAVTAYKTQKEKEERDAAMAKKMKADGDKKKHSDNTVLASTDPVNKKGTEKGKTTSKPDTATDRPHPAPLKSDVMETRQQVSSASADTARRIRSNMYNAFAQRAIVEKNYQRAQQFLDTAVQLWSTNYDSWFTKAEVNERLNEREKALADYEQCGRIDSTKAKLYYNMALLHLQLGDRAEGLKKLNNAIRLDDKYVAAYMKRASVYNDTAMYKAAIADFDYVLRLNKNAYQAYKGRGYANMMQRNFKQAIDDFTRYNIYDQSDAEVYYYRGLAKINNNDWLDGCLELSMSASMGYTAAAVAAKKNCE